MGKKQGARNEKAVQNKEGGNIQKPKTQAKLEENHENYG